MWLWRGWVGYSCHMGQLALLADNFTLWTTEIKKNLEIGLTSPALTSHKKVFVIFSRAVHALHFRVLAARTCPISGFQSIFCNLPQRQILALCFSKREKWRFSAKSIRYKRNVSKSWSRSYELPAFSIKCDLNSSCRITCPRITTIRQNKLVSKKSLPNTYPYPPPTV